MTGALRVTGAGSAAGRRLRTRIAGRLERVLDRATESEARRLVERVRRGGDAALVALARELDGAHARTAAELRLEIRPEDRSGRLLTVAERRAVERAIAAAERVHAAQAEGERGVELVVGGLAVREIVRPLVRAGVYVPGGRAAYPSTAILAVVPAQVAGVREVVVATPARGWSASPLLRFALARLGVEEIWGLGGAHAIAALAYGTATVARVDALVGPGNAWVTAAKRLVAGRVAVDGLMGPSEVVVVAGDGADPDWIAADLLAQAEHDPSASALLVTGSRRLARAVAERVEARLDGLPTAAVARESLRGFGGALVVDGLEAAVELVDELAPEHLQLVGREVEAMAGRFVSAGAVFVGARVPEVLGDYVAGPSHVLPTCGSARFASGLSVRTFQRRFHRLEALPDGRGEPGALARMAGDAALLAAAEGLPAHAAAAALRAEAER